MTNLPAEWEPHAATWLSWPHNEETWPGLFDRIEPAFRQIVTALAPSEHVRINARSAAHGEHISSGLHNIVPSGSYTIHIVPTNDAWIRDHGAIFVRSPSDDLIALDFEYNAWGGKYPPYDLDQDVAARMGEILDVPVRRLDFVLEGGSIDGNGDGALLTTEQCLLNRNRNPSLDRTGIETVLCRELGTNQIIWLGDGIEGDDTDGHVDDLTRFVARARVVTVVETNRSDPNYAPLAANRRRLEDMHLNDGSRLDVVELPMPAPVFNQGLRLPASYANFYVANDVVLVPQFGCPADRAACSILADCFSARRIEAIDCRALVAGLGAVHCLTQQVPAIVAGPAIS